MSALALAFDITIVGALALSWVILIVDLFFVSKENSLKDVLKLGSDRSAPVLGVLLFALAYFLGSAISRVGQDFLDDDDVLNGFKFHWPTESNIRANAYCDKERELEALIKDSTKAFPLTYEELHNLCEGHRRYTKPKSSKGFNINDVFRLQESALLLNGEDKTAWLRQLHAQLMVLRGAVLNGFIAFCLSLFGLCANAKENPCPSTNARTGHQRASTNASPSTPPKIVIRWAQRHWRVPPLVLLGIALWTSFNHVRHRTWFEPPFLEFTFFVLAGLGVVRLFIKTNGENPDSPATSQNGWRINYWVAVCFSALLTPMAWLSWWLTEVLYDDRVIYSFYTLGHQMVP